MQGKIILNTMDGVDINNKYCRSDNKKLINILKYLDTGITDYNMRVMNETAFKEYFPNETLDEKFLHKPGLDNSIKSKRILNIGDILFELDYDEKGAKRIEKLMFRHGRDESQYEYGEETGLEKFNLMTPKTFDYTDEAGTERGIYGKGL